jgi:acetyl-CoA carboxylase carboxyltransferase component
VIAAGPRSRRQRAGDTDTTSVAGLDVPTFRLTAGLAGRVPLVAVVSGYCFAGNAALAAACDVIDAADKATAFLRL